MLQAVAYATSDECTSSARVVRLKSLEEIARAKAPEDSQLQAALQAVQQASELMAMMQERCTDIERQAEAYVYQSRDDVRKAREQIVLLEQQLRQGEEHLRGLQTQCTAQALQIRELELSNRELLHRAGVAEEALTSKSNAVATLQTAIKDHLEAGLKHVDSMGATRLGLISPSAA